MDCIPWMDLLTQRATPCRGYSKLGVCCVQELGETLRRDDDRGL